MITKHTVARSMICGGWEVAAKRRPVDAARAFVSLAHCIVDAEAMADRPSGRAFLLRARRTAREIGRGAVVAADLFYLGNHLTYTAAP